MGTIATNTKDQIEILKERGMTFDIPEEKVKEILLDIGYYRLGFYWNPFEIDKNHFFNKDTFFSTSVDLYYLDVDIRNILMKYLNRIEINFRTKIVYYVSNKYKNSPTWFIDAKVVNGDFIDNFHKYYNEDFKKNNQPIKQHHLKYINHKYAPAWKTLEFLTFGTILFLYKSLNDVDIKERISNLYGIKSVDKFINFFDHIVIIRNICAHGGVLFDFNSPKGISILPNLQFNNNNRHSLDSNLKIIQLILENISSDRNKEMTEQINTLFMKHKDNKIIRRIIEDKIGFIY